MQINIYEALTEAGVKPDAARNVERQMEAALQSNQDAIRAEVRDHVFTKADGAQIEAQMAQLETRILKAVNDLTWKLVTFVIAANGIMLAALKHFG
jgi:2-phosphoglycerate kinase